MGIVVVILWLQHPPSTRQHSPGHHHAFTACLEAGFSIDWGWKSRLWSIHTKQGNCRHHNFARSSADCRCNWKFHSYVCFNYNYNQL